MLSYVAYIRHSGARLNPNTIKFNRAEITKCDIYPVTTLLLHSFWSVDAKYRESVCHDNGYRI